MDIIDLRYNRKRSCFDINEDNLNIWAHSNELLGEHISKTRIIFSRIMNKEIIKEFYNYFYQKDYINIDFASFLKYIDEMIRFHDIAKISFNFQVNRLKNTEIADNLKKNNLNEYIERIEAKHSYISSLLYVSYLYDSHIEMKWIEDNKLLLLFAYAIYGHHTSIKDISINEFINDKNLYAKSKPTFYLFSMYIFSTTIREHKDYKKLQDLVHSFLKEKSEDSKISFFYSYIYSLLVTSDIIASSYYDKDIESVRKCSEDWNNRINAEITNLMEQNFYKLDHNNRCREISSKDLLCEEEINSLSHINDLRTEMLKEASFNLIKSLKADPNRKVFYLNMPTGGGKTNTSMKLALDILKNTDIDRIIYAMPFINIIEQNYEYIKKNFGLNEDNGEIMKIYSASESIFDENKSKMIMRDSFFDYPVICTTFVSLFNALIKNKKKYKYFISALTNSVIILDEIQSLPLKNWTSLYYLINEISKNYNIYFIIMSATLPKFEKLKLRKDLKFDYENVHLINDPTKYFLHPLFDRTEIKGQITELDADDSLELSTYFKDIIEKNFQKGYNKGLIVLNTIKLSKQVYDILYKLKEDEFEIDLLNSTILPSEKRKIIDKIKNETKYILVSTQSIEAGVDVSFDFVFRDFATLDSIEQVRGRCNRSGELNKRFKDETKKGNVYLMNIKRGNQFDHRFIYDNEELEIKIKETQLLLDNYINYDYGHVLDYYNAISSNINKIQDENQENFVIVDRNNVKCWNRLKYSKLLDKYYGIHIIQNKGNQYSFFAATNIDILTDNKKLKIKSIESINMEKLRKIYEDKDNKDKFIFTFKEIKYLKKYESKYGVNLITNNSVDGSKLINCYIKCIEKLKKNIEAKKILQKEFSSILYKFIFQVTGNELEFEELKIDQELECRGFFCIIPENKIGNGEKYIYSIENGFNFDFIKKKKRFC